MAYTTIKKPSDYFDTKLHNGNATAKTLAYDFEVDMFWTKLRNDAYPHNVYDSVRGANQQLRTNLNNAVRVTGDTVSFGNSSGVSLGADSGSYGTNKTLTDGGSQATYVGWGWKANGAGSSNTDGSITSSVSANTTSGFSIVSYTGNGSAGATIGHGLSAPLGMVIVKARDTSGNWRIFHKNLGTDQYINLDETGAAVTFSGIFQTNSFTNNVFSVGNHSSVNGSGGTFIAYCFAEKQGFSKFGSYVGNGNADGTFVYTGFKPAFVMIKEISSTGYQWTIVDNKRNPTNDGSMKWLFPDNSGVETTESTWDLLSNGFKQRANHSYVNHSGTHIYMAFAEQPLVGDNPATAR